MPAEGAVRHREPSSLRLIETLRWEPAKGFLRLDRHMARLAGSAAELGFPCEQHRVAAAMEAAVDQGMRQRVRLTLGADGTIDCTTQSFTPLPPDWVWRLAVAGTRLDSGDPLLRHKTTQRDLYEAARAEYRAADIDEVLLLNERGEVCEGTITSLFVDPGDGGPLQTPPLASGLLAGVFRAEMLEMGLAVEATLTLADLRAAAGCAVGNSLRGLIRARLVEAGGLPEAGPAS